MKAIVAFTLALFLTVLVAQTVNAQEAPTVQHAVYLPQVGATCIAPTTPLDQYVQSFPINRPAVRFEVTPNPCGGDVLARIHWCEVGVDCPQGRWGTWLSVEMFTTGTFRFTLPVAQMLSTVVRLNDTVQFVDTSLWSFNVKATQLTNP